MSEGNQKLVEDIARALFVLDYGRGELFDRWSQSGPDTGEAQAMMEKSLNRARAVAALLSPARDELAVILLNAEHSWWNQNHGYELHKPLNQADFEIYEGAGREISRAQADAVIRALKGAPAQPAGLEPRGCPTPGACSCAVPEGWKLVPVEPTEEIVAAIKNYHPLWGFELVRGLYADTLAAAPTPPAR